MVRVVIRPNFLYGGYPIPARLKFNYFWLVFSGKTVLSASDALDGKTGGVKLCYKEGDFALLKERTRSARRYMELENQR